MSNVSFKVNECEPLIPGGKPDDESKLDYECGCMSGALTKKQCAAKAAPETWRNAEPYVPDDGYPGVEGLWDNMVTVVFKNGAVLHSISDHPFLDWPAGGCRIHPFTSSFWQSKA